MKRKPSPPAKDIRAPWQIAQAATCPCRGSDDYCACQNVDQSDPAQRYPTRADLEQRIRELEGAVSTLELQQQTDRQTIASLLAARPAVVSAEVVSRMTQRFYEHAGDSIESMRAALALLPGGVSDGYVLVPREPTDEMTEAARLAYEHWLLEGASRVTALRRAYRAMLSASPKGSSRSQPSRTTQEPPSPTPCDLEGAIKRLTPTDDEDPPLYLRDAIAKFSRSCGDV